MPPGREMSTAPSARSHAALVPGASSEAYVRLSGSLASGVIVLCDHARNTLPQAYGTLGLPVAELQRHIAYDIGAAGVTERLAASLGAPAVMTRFSRLLIDCNRGEDDPTLIMRLSDGAVIPGNRALTVEERAARIARFYEPYHQAVSALIDFALAQDVVPVLLSIHSFTPSWRGKPRPWHAGVLWDKDPRLALPLVASLSADPSLITTDAGQAEWAARLADAMKSILAAPPGDTDLRSIKFFGSHADDRR